MSCISKLLLISTFLLNIASINAEERISIRESDRTPQTHITIRSFMGNYSTDNIVKELRSFIACCRPSRFAGSGGHSRVVDYLQTRIKELDRSESERSRLFVHEFDPDFDRAIEHYENDFRENVASVYDSTDEEYQKWRMFTDTMTEQVREFKKEELKGKNLVWELTGHERPEEVLILGAHYDTIVFDDQTHLLKTDVDMPGADKNASGVAALLAAIEIFSQLELPQTLRIIFYDLQEFAGMGMHAYVSEYSESLKKEAIGYLDIMMIGHDSKISDGERSSGQYRAYIRTENKDGHKKDRKFVSSIVEQAKLARTRVNFDISETFFDGGGHRHFWELGIAAGLLSQDRESDLNQRQHTSNDFVETLNLSSYDQAFRSIVAAVIGYSFNLRN